MFKVKIYIYDTAKAEENDRLGFDKNKVPFVLTDFIFKAEKLTGYWVDIETNDDTKTRDIIFYVDGQCFRTPYNPITVKYFDDILLKPIKLHIEK